jgi:hypothetical protein
MFKQCKQKYLLSAIHGWQPDFGSTAIRYGVAWHAIQEGYHSWIAKNGWPKTPSEQMEAITAGLDLGKRKWDKETEEKKFFEDYRNFNTLVDNFNAYLEFFSTDKDYIKIITTETKFECPILPENSAEEKILDKLPPTILYWSYRLMRRMDYQKWIFDFKTTGWILDKVIAEANRSPQLIGYSYAGKRVLNFEPNGCLASFSFAGSSKSRKTGEYGAPTASSSDVYHNCIQHQILLHGN